MEIFPDIRAVEFYRRSGRKHFVIEAGVEGAGDFMSRGRVRVVVYKLELSGESGNVFGIDRFVHDPSVSVFNYIAGLEGFSDVTEEMSEDDN